MENITINQKQLFDVIKRTISLSKEYAIEKLDADGNFIVFVNGDFTNFFILRKSIVDYIATKSSVYANLQDSYNKFVESAKERAKELINREDEIKSLKKELKVLREEKKCKSYVVAKANYDELYKTHEELLSRNEELNSIVKHNNTEITVLRDTVEQLRAKIKTQDAIIEINKEKIEKKDKELQSYKNSNKQYEFDL